MPPAPLEPDDATPPETQIEPEKQIEPRASAAAERRLDAPMDTAADAVLVVDFGAQYAQLIARRVRECHVYSEIVPWTMPVEQMLARKPKAVILSGGPSSVYAPNAPAVDPSWFTTGVPTLGICYGHQAMAQALGGVVERAGIAAYGGPSLSVGPAGVLYADLPETQSVWMSHGDTVTAAPPGFA